MAKRIPKLGDRAFEVEWCTHIPLDENGDAVLDQATNEFRIIYDRDTAWALAKEVYPKDFFGSVRITPVEYTDPFDDGIPQTYLWEAYADSDFYDGEPE